MYVLAVRRILAASGLHNQPVRPQSSPVVRRSSSFFTLEQRLGPLGSSRHAPNSWVIPLDTPAQALAAAFTQPNCTLLVRINEILKLIYGRAVSARRSIVAVPL